MEDILLNEDYKEKWCCNCRHFKEYYIKKNDRYEKTEFGRCLIFHEELQYKTDCERFEKIQEESQVDLDKSIYELLQTTMELQRILITELNNK